MDSTGYRAEAPREFQQPVRVPIAGIILRDADGGDEQILSDAIGLRDYEMIGHWMAIRHVTSCEPIDNKNST